MSLSIESVEILILVAALVAMVARRLRLPYTVGLVITGVGLAFFPQHPHIELSKELIFSAFLPPLIFEASIHIRWDELRANLLPVSVLATVGVAISAIVTTAGMQFGAHWQWQAALVFGVLIAATDPVSVIATFKELGIRGRLGLLIEADSLFNDGTAAVGFSVVLAAISGPSVSAADTCFSFLTTVFGGVLCGALTAGAMLLIAGRTDDHLIELAFTTVVAFSSFLVAEHFHVSGVLSTLTAGVMVGNIGPLGVITDRGRQAVIDFWDYIAFAANSLIFLLIGIQTVKQDFSGLLIPSGIAVIIVLVGRAVAVYGCCALFSRSKLRIDFRHQHVLVWGGLRGALALALALGLPQTVPQREQILAVSFAVVAFSIVVQGMTMTPLLRRLNLLSNSSGAVQEEE